MPLSLSPSSSSSLSLLLTLPLLPPAFLLFFLWFFSTFSFLPNNFHFFPTLCKYWVCIRIVMFWKTLLNCFGLKWIVEFKNWKLFSNISLLFFFQLSFPIFFHMIQNSFPLAHSLCHIFLSIQRHHLHHHHSRLITLSDSCLQRYFFLPLLTLERSQDLRFSREPKEV